MRDEERVDAACSPTCANACELDPARAAQRDASIRAQSAQKAGETAADLIPAISTGFVAQGTPAAGQRETSTP